MAEPTREIFWNIQLDWLMYSLAAIATVVLLWSVYRHYLRWRAGQPANRGDHLRQRIRVFCRTAFIDLLLHRKFLGAEKPFRAKELYPGLMHFFIFGGFFVLLLGAFLDFVSHYIFEFMEGDFYLGYSIVTDIFGILGIIGVLMAVFRRYILKAKRLDNRLDDIITLLLILLVFVTGFVVEGLRIAATEMQVNPDWDPSSTRRKTWSRPSTSKAVFPVLSATLTATASCVMQRRYTSPRQ